MRVHTRTHKDTQSLVHTLPIFSSQTPVHIRELALSHAHKHTRKHSPLPLGTEPLAFKAEEENAETVEKKARK